MEPYFDFPFISEVYHLVGSGKLEECEKKLRGLFQRAPRNVTMQMKLIDHEILFPFYGEWMHANMATKSWQTGYVINIDFAEFEINLDRFWTRICLFEGYDNKLISDAREWLCETEGKAIGEIYSLDADSKLLSLANQLLESGFGIESEIFSVYYYLAFVLFCQATRHIHVRAKLDKLVWGQGIVFCYDGDLLYKSD